MLGHDHRRRGRIPPVDHHVALGTGQEEGGDVVGADIVEVAGDAEWLGGLLAADLVGVQPPAGDDQRDDDQHAEDREPVSEGEGARHGFGSLLGTAAGGNRVRVKG